MIEGQLTSFSNNQCGVRPRRRRSTPPLWARPCLVRSALNVHSFFSRSISSHRISTSPVLAHIKSRNSRATANGTQIPLHTIQTGVVGAQHRAALQTGLLAPGPTFQSFHARVEIRRKKLKP